MPTVKGDGMRGLAVFISDIRNCKGREAELKRINRELANIRTKFKGDKVLDGYSKKKYVCKLLFIFLLGHDVDFGYTEAVNLMTSNRYTEKQIGYLYISVMLRPTSDLMQLVIQNISADLNSSNPVFQNLALQCLANIATKEMAETFIDPVGKMLASPEVLDELKQSASLTLLSLAQCYPQMLNYDEMVWIQRIPDLIHSHNLGVVTASCSLISLFCKIFPKQMREVLSACISRLYRIIATGYSEFQDYTYYFVPAPWLCIKLMKLLQSQSLPDHPGDVVKLNETLDAILIKAQDSPKSKKIQHSNAKNAVLFEAINLIIHYDCEPSALVRAAALLGQFLQHRETNMRYLAMESLCLLATSEIAHNAIRTHMDTVIDALKNERDLSVRQKALNLLYAMCDKQNSECIVKEMLAYLANANFLLKEDLVLKIAILAEKYAVNFSWYIDVMLCLIRMAGDFVADEVWHRVIHVIVNQEEVQAYAARTCFDSLRYDPCHETMVKVGSYVLGEFGNLIANEPESSPAIQLAALHSRYSSCSHATRYILLSTYVKFARLYPEIKPRVEAIFELDQNIRSNDTEIQQRAVEYLSMCRNCSASVLDSVLEVMPAFPDRVLNSLQRFKNRTNAAGGPSEVKEDSILQVTASKLAEVRDPALYDNGLLIDTTNEPDIQAVTPPIGTVVSVNFACLSMCHTGVLYEDSRIQIGFKESYNENSGQLKIFLGNKSSVALTNLRWTLPQSARCPEISWITPVKETEIGPGQQVPGLIGIQCRGPFVEIPSSNLTFHLGNDAVSNNLVVRLPVMLNKFSKPATMDRNAFATRWRSMNGPGQEAVRMDSVQQKEMTEERLTASVNAFGWSIIPEIDQNPRNICGAGVVNMGANFQSGVLYRLERDPVAEPTKENALTRPFYRLTVRSAKVDVAAIIADLFYW